MPDSFKVGPPNLDSDFRSPPCISALFNANPVPPEVEGTP